MNASNYGPVTPGVVEELKRICGAKFVYFDDQKKLEKYSRDKVPGRYGHMPEVVVMPRTAPEIAQVVKLANREMIPITPRAAGTVKGHLCHDGQVGRNHQRRAWYRPQTERFYESRHESSAP